MAIRRVKLTFPSNLVKEPVTFRMAKEFDIMPNIRRAKVTETMGEMVMELEGSAENLEKGLNYLTGVGVKVEPVSGNIVE